MWERIWNARRTRIEVIDRPDGDETCCFLSTDTLTIPGFEAPIQQSYDRQKVILSRSTSFETNVGKFSSSEGTQSLMLGGLGCYLTICQTN